MASSFVSYEVKNMSINIRYLTNGKKSVYVVRNSGVSPVEINYFDNKDEIPNSIRHYAPDGEPWYRVYRRIL